MSYSSSFSPSGGGSSSGRNQPFWMRGEKRRLRARKPRAAGVDEQHAQRPPRTPKVKKPKPTPQMLGWSGQQLSVAPKPPKPAKPPKPSPHFLGPPVPKPKQPKKTSPWGY